MSERRDQLQSYQFVMQRVVSALVMRETDPVRSPFRRAAGAMLASVMVAIIALAGVALFGVISPGGNTSWKNEGAIVIEKETGARYVYLGGKLHPVANYASALLLAKSASAKPVSVARASISGVTRGRPLGIPGAPDSLPSARNVSTSAWSLCSRQLQDTAGATKTESIVYVGREATQAKPLADNALIAKSASGVTYLVWHGHRYAIRDAQLILPALGFSEAPAGLAPAWLNALPSGADLARIAVPARGTPSKLPNVRTGQVVLIETQGGERQYHVALADGLAAITQVQADILLGDPETPAAQQGALRMSPAEYATSPRAGSLIPEAGPAAPPATTPKSTRPARADAAICATYRDASGSPEITLDATAQVPDATPATGGSTRDGALLADRIIVEPGSGALVSALPSPTAPAGSLAIVTDLGVRYPIPAPDVQKMLGYATTTPLRLPAALVALIPAGPPLDPATALTPVLLN
ncbi:type VII secretion protein EccB [Longispora albida]|uniref:type VII secretion protein EccB n=1 Tax=Longispora albida TaxID=203523 RepID=UPI00036EF589|nr:type VII secretion protein EccB [Longispora albida]